MSTFSTFLCGAMMVASSPVHADAVRPERLLVEQYGARDAALRPFSVMIGAPEASTRDLVLVAPDAYDRILGIVFRGTIAVPLDPVAIWTFRITVLTVTPPSSDYFVARSDMLAIIGAIRQSADERHDAMPAWLSALEAMLASSR